MHTVRNTCRAILVAVAVAAAAAADPVAYPGRVEALNRVDVSARVDSVVTRIHFQPGQEVHQGEVLFSLDRTDFVQALKAAQAAELKAVALADEAMQDLERNRALKDRGTITDVRLFRSQAAAAITDAAVAEARARVEAAQVALDRTYVRAPITGIIGRAQVSRGGFAEAGRRGVLATIVQLDPVRLVYDIPYPDRLIELGISDLTTVAGYADTIDLEVDIAPGWTHPVRARPTFLAPEINDDGRTISAWAVVANPTHVLRPGMKVTVRPVPAAARD